MGGARGRNRQISIDDPDATRPKLEFAVTLVLLSRAPVHGSGILPIGRPRFFEVSNEDRSLLTPPPRACRCRSILPGEMTKIYRLVSGTELAPGASAEDRIAWSGPEPSGYTVSWTRLTV